MFGGMGQGGRSEERRGEGESEGLRLPNLAIHLNREMGTEFKWNKETNL